jgi:hypothetical protein
VRNLPLSLTHVAEMDTVVSASQRFQIRHPLFSVWTACPNWQQAPAKLAHLGESSSDAGLRAVRARWARYAAGASSSLVIATSRAATDFLRRPILPPILPPTE